MRVTVYAHMYKIVRATEKHVSQHIYMKSVQIELFGVLNDLLMQIIVILPCVATRTLNILRLFDKPLM